jgi:hypothetical protein
MKGEEAVEIFQLAIKQKDLSLEKIDDLVPMSFVGQAAVNFYRDKIKLMDQLNMTEEQRKATLKDGQDAGEMLLDIEGRIGELALKEPQIQSKPIHKKGHKGALGTQPSGEPPKHERLGLPSERKMQASQIIHKNPKIVEKVKAQARANEDIPTKTAVLNEIRYEKEKERRKKAEANKTENKVVTSIEQIEYINALERCISILPQKPPEKWDEKPLKEATGYAKIITKRLEVFVNG